MVEVDKMSVEELEAYMLTFPSDSPCARAELSKLQADLNIKKHIASLGD